MQKDPGAQNRASEEEERRSFQQIQTTVEDLRDLAKGRLALEGVMYSLAASINLFVFAVVLMIFVPGLWWVRALIALAWGLLCASLLWFRWLKPVQKFRDLSAVSRLLEEKYPDLRSDVSASLQFGRELDDLRAQDSVSVAMIGRLLTQTRQNLSKKSTALLREAIPQAQLKAPTLAGAGALVVMLALAGGATDLTRQGVERLLFGPELVEVEDSGRFRTSLIGDVIVRYKFPEYTGLGQKMMANSTGEIEAVKGTVIELEGVALRPLKKASLVLKTPGVGEEKEQQQNIVLERRVGGRLVASFTVLHSGTYTVEAELPDGKEAFDGIERPLRVIPDENPRVDLLKPQGEVEVSPADKVSLDYQTWDDFGVSEVAVVTLFAGDENTRKRSVIFSLDEEKEVLPGDARPAAGGNVALNRAQQRLGFPAPGHRFSPSAPNGAPREQSLEHELDLAPMNLQAGDQLTVYLEVVDTDTISGPKIATSEPLLLKVSSPEDKHMDLIKRQEEVFEKLLDVLGDYLESPVKETYEERGIRTKGIPSTWSAAQISERFGVAIPPHQKALQVQGSLEEILAQLEQDPLTLKRDFLLFETLVHDLNNHHKRESDLMDKMRPAAKAERLSRLQLARLAGARDRTIHGTEKSLIKLEDLIAAQRMENLLDTAKSLKEAKERLKDLLKKYAETKDPALKAEIMRQMKRLQEKMREIAENMQSQIKKLPREHVNMEALERKEMANKAQDVSNGLEELMKALEEGNLDDAMAMLDQMDDNIDAMLSEMESEFADSQPEGVSEIDKKAAELMDDLNDLEVQEKAIAEDTQKLTEEIKRENEAKGEEVLKAFQEKAREQVKDLQKKLDDANSDELRRGDQQSIKRARKTSERLEKALNQNDLGQAMAESQDLQQELEQSSFGLEFEDRNSFRNRQENGSRQRKKQNAQRSARQKVKEAKSQAKSLHQDLMQAIDDAQGQPSEAQSEKLSELAQKQRQTQKKASDLNQKIQEAGEDFPALGEKLGEGMQETERFMEQAQQRLGEGKGQKAHQSEKMALEKIGGLKSGLKQVLKKEKMGGNSPGDRPSSREKVKIPGKSDAAPKAFREDIMDAMKEENLNEYESELQEYYKSLVR